MSIAEPQPDATNPSIRWYRLTPDRFVIGLLVVEGFLWVSDRFGWLPWHKGYAVLTAVVLVGVLLLAMLLWWVAALLFRWRFQFSIRSMLVLVVAVAVPCSWLAVTHKHAQEQAREVAAIQELGGQVIYDSPVHRLIHNKPVGLAAPDWLRSLLGQDYFDDIIEVDFNHGHVTDEGLAHVSGLLRLHWISLFNKQVTDKCLVHLYGLKNLDTVVLRHTSVSKDGEERLKEALPNVQVIREWE